MAELLEEPGGLPVEHHDRAVDPELGRLVDRRRYPEPQDRTPRDRPAEQVVRLESVRGDQA
ncbi:MAG: hypothetical protein ACLQD8_08985, partial [Thermoplasmata archaeon]